MFNSQYIFIQGPFSNQLYYRIHQGVTHTICCSFFQQNMSVQVLFHVQWLSVDSCNCSVHRPDPPPTVAPKPVGSHQPTSH